MQPITIIKFAVRVGAYVRTNTDAPCMFIWAMFWWYPTRAPNKTAALAQEWAVWSKPTLDLMHVTLTARKQRVYSKLVFKMYKNAPCNWLRKLSKRNVEFHCKAQCANTQQATVRPAAPVVEVNYYCSQEEITL